MVSGVSVHSGIACGKAGYHSVRTEKHSSHNCHQEAETWTGSGNGLPSPCSILFYSARAPILWDSAAHVQTALLTVFSPLQSCPFPILASCNAVKLTGFGRAAFAAFGRV